jgi:hypothetical protein
VEVELDEVRLATLGPVHRRADQLAEEGVGPFRPALELRMGLGAHPEGVTRKLDELDQSAVG